ncbi:MAG: hypothetical protein ABR540_08850 [Acidimicrobiales bacterium]
MELPLSYRVNALLYLLGGLAFFFLVSTLVAGDDGGDRKVQVGAGVVTTKPKPPSTTVARPATTVTTTAAVTTTVARAGVATAANPGGGGTTTATDPPDYGSETPDPPQTEETLPPLVIVCRDSVDERCGNFFWDPAPPANQPIEVIVNSSPAVVGRPVTFTVTVTEPDRAMDAACVSVDYGDGGRSAPCPEPPCPTRFGPWTPAGPGPRTSKPPITFTHTYNTNTANPYTVTVTVDTRSDCKDPFGQRVPTTRSITVAPPA